MADSLGQVSKRALWARGHKDLARRCHCLVPQQAAETSASKVKKQKKRTHPLSAEDSLEVLSHACFQLTGVRVYKETSNQSNRSLWGYNSQVAPSTPHFLRLLRSISSQPKCQFTLTFFPGTLAYVPSAWILFTKKPH